MHRPSLLELLVLTAACVSVLLCACQDEPRTDSAAGKPHAVDTTRTPPHDRQATKVEADGASRMNSMDNRIPERVLRAARQLRDNHNFRGAFILDRARSESYPRLLQRTYDLTDAELAELCWAAMKIHWQYRNDQLGELSGLIGYTIDPSSDWWQAARYKSSESDDVYVPSTDEILKAIGFELDDDSQNDSNTGLDQLGDILGASSAGKKASPYVKPKGTFRMERVETGEVVATLDGLVIGFGPDSYATTFEYGRFSYAGIPDGGETTPVGEDDEPIGRAVRVISGGELIDEVEDGEEVRYYRLNDVLYCGDVTSKRVLYYIPFGSEARIHRLIADGRWETTFAYDENPVRSLPSLTTRDLRTGEVVYRAFDLTPIRTNVMQVREEYYSDGRVVSDLVTERSTGLGILVDIKSISAPIPRNYFAIDFVLSGWPFGSRW